MTYALKAKIEEAAEFLEAVRTGEDFECECWKCAEELRETLKAELTLEKKQQHVSWNASTECAHAKEC